MTKLNASIRFYWMWLSGITWAVTNIVRSAILNLGVSDAASSTPLRVFVAILVQTMVLASMIGVAQWALIRSYLTRSHRWVIGTAIWGSIGLVVGYVVAGLITFPIADVVLAPDAPPAFGLTREASATLLSVVLFLIQGLIGGLIMGIAQQRILNNSFIGANGWILWNTVGFGLASVLWVLIASLLHPDESVMSSLSDLQAALVRITGDGVSGLAGGLGYGLLTGWALSRMERQQNEATNSPILP